MKKLFSVILFAYASSAFALEEGGAFDQGNALSCEKCIRTIPRHLWDFMDGYEYEYAKGCTAAWHSRTSTFLYGGRSCPEISLEKLTSDALKSIEYVKKNTNYKNFSEYFYETKYKKQMQQNYSIQQSRFDARHLWNRACIDAKSFKFVSAKEIAKDYPYLDTLHATRLVRTAYDMVVGLNGVVNCAAESAYVVDAYVEGIDIRKK